MSYTIGVSPPLKELIKPVDSSFLEEDELVDI